MKSLGEDTAQFESTYDSVTGNFIPSHKGHLHHTKAVVFWPASCNSMFMTSKNHLMNYCLLKIILIVNFLLKYNIHSEKDISHVFSSINYHRVKQPYNITKVKK